jgi:hypothetical protein
MAISARSGSGERETFMRRIRIIDALSAKSLLVLNLSRSDLEIRVTGFLICAKGFGRNVLKSYRSRNTMETVFQTSA